MRNVFISLAIWLTALIIIISVGRMASADKASYYSYHWAGRKTANGEVFIPTDYTAASRTLPFGTYVKVTNIQNGKSVVVRINDRGPYVKGRTIDLSYGAAEAIDMCERGVAEVEIVVLT